MGSTTNWNFLEPCSRFHCAMNGERFSEVKTSYIWANYDDFSRVLWAGDFIKVHTHTNQIVFDRAETLRRFELKHLLW